MVNIERRIAQESSLQSTNNPKGDPKDCRLWREDYIAFIKTTYDISLDFGKSLLPRGFSPAIFSLLHSHTFGYPMGCKRM